MKYTHGADCRQGSRKGRFRKGRAEKAGRKRQDGNGRKENVVAEDGLEGSKKRTMSDCSKCTNLFTSKPVVKEHLEANHSKIANTNVSLSNS